MSGGFEVQPVVPKGVVGADVAALAALQTYAGQELTRLQARSEKWIGGLTAITGVLTTAIVIKGPESFTSLEPFFAGIVALLMVAGGLLVGFGIYKGFSAAHGDPLTTDVLMTRAKEQAIDGAYKDYVNAMHAGATDARSALKAATLSSIFGTLALAAAVVITWVGPEEKAAAADTYCFMDGSTVVEMEGSPTVTSGSITVVPCPEKT